MSRRLLASALVALLAVLLGSPGVPAEDGVPTREGEIYRRLQADLNRDGRAETVALVAYGLSDSGWFGQLQVTDAAGKVLWKGPRPTDAADPMAFGGWDWGIADLQVAGDLDRDGSVEILGPLPQSDVSPTTFRILRWDGKAFRRVFSRCLLETPFGSGRYQWVAEPGFGGKMRWIGSFESASRDGTCVVRIYEVNGSATRLGTATVGADPKGFHVVRWIEPPR